MKKNNVDNNIDDMTEYDTTRKQLDFNNMSKYEDDNLDDWVYEFDI